MDCVCREAALFFREREAALFFSKKSPKWNTMLLSEKKQQHDAVARI
jgi:hypothetical protein